MQITVRYTVTQHVGEHSSGFACLTNGCLHAEHTGVLTTDRAESSYGVPVLVSDDGTVLTAYESHDTPLYKGGCEATSSAAAEEYDLAVATARKHGYNVL